MDKSVYKIRFTGSFDVEVPKESNVILEKFTAAEKGKNILLDLELEKDLILHFTEIEFSHIKKEVNLPRKKVKEVKK